jgi:glycosyltransferase involved in cell wall biosynthesis
MMASRLLVDKGVREFVNAARMLKQKNKDVRCVLVGAPDLANPATITEGELAEWSNEGIIEWWGHQNDMPEVIASSYAFVLPSFYGEGLPKALIEAAACGRAIITTDHPGCRDAIEPNKTGFLIPPRDSEALADAIEALLDDPALCESMGRAGRKFAERVFDIKYVVDRHMQIYENN